MIFEKKIGMRWLQKLVCLFLCVSMLSTSFGTMKVHADWETTEDMGTFVRHYVWDNVYYNTSHYETRKVESGYTECHTEQDYSDVWVDQWCEDYSDSWVDYWEDGYTDEDDNWVVTDSGGGYYEREYYEYYCGGYEREYYDVEVCNWVDTSHYESVWVTSGFTQAEVVSTYDVAKTAPNPGGGGAGTWRNEIINPDPVYGRDYDENTFQCSGYHDTWNYDDDVNKIHYYWRTWTCTLWQKQIIPASDTSPPSSVCRPVDTWNYDDNSNGIHWFWRSWDCGGAGGDTSMPTSYASGINSLLSTNSNWQFEFYNAGITLSEMISKHHNRNNLTCEANWIDQSDSTIYENPCWRMASEYGLQQTIDPNSNDSFNTLDVYQYMVLTHSSAETVSGLNNLFTGTDLAPYPQDFLTAGSSDNISSYYLAASAKVESGDGSSAVGSVNGVTVYNFFGIGATTGCGAPCGFQYAYEQGWFDPVTAIIGGASLAHDYISVGQDTIYTMKFNLPGYTGGSFSHEYAANIGKPYQESRVIAQGFGSTANVSLKFKVPVYN